jgi:ketosteroid isomerase-like protein
MSDNITLGQNLVSAVAARDADRLAACFADDAVLRALIPPGLRERAGAREAAELVHSWFADAEPLDLVDSEVEELSDRLHVRYRFEGTEEGEEFVVEQHVFGTVERGKLMRADVICSGFRPRAAPGR